MIQGQSGKNMVFVQCSDPRIRKGAKAVTFEYGFDGKPFGLIAIPGGATGQGVLSYIEFFHKQRGVDVCILSIHPDCLWGTAHGRTPEQMHAEMHVVADQVRALGINEVHLHFIKHDGTHINCACHHAHQQILQAVNE